jgi:hypothetical protein
MLEVINGETKIHDIFWNILQTSFNPWQDVLSYIKVSLVEKGILQTEEKGKILFIKTYKTTLAGEIPAEEVKKQEEYERDLNNLKQDSNLYEKITAAINSGISSRLDNDSSFND